MNKADSDFMFEQSIKDKMVGIALEVIKSDVVGPISDRCIKIIDDRLTELQSRLTKEDVHACRDGF